MAIIKWEYGLWDSFWGYQCSQCKIICPFIEGAIAHEKAIDENGGICPKIEKTEK